MASRPSTRSRDEIDTSLTSFSLDRVISLPADVIIPVVWANKSEMLRNALDRPSRDEVQSVGLNASAPGSLNVSKVSSILGN